MLLLVPAAFAEMPVTFTPDAACDEGEEIVASVDAPEGWTVSWTAEAGTFADAEAATTTFVCPEVEADTEVTVYVVVMDAGGQDWTFAKVAVRDVPAPETGMASDEDGKTGGTGCATSATAPWGGSPPAAIAGLLATALAARGLRRR